MERYGGRQERREERRLKDEDGEEGTMQMDAEVCACVRVCVYKRGVIWSWKNGGIRIRVINLTGGKRHNVVLLTLHLHLHVCLDMCVCVYIQAHEHMRW